METKKCAVYIDLENLATSKSGSAISIPCLMETIKRTISQKFFAQSLFILNMAVGNSESISVFDDTLIKYNFDIRTVKKISTIPEKSGNRADLILSLDAFETLLMPDTSIPDIYIFVTRDSDFSVIMGKLRKYGKQVFLVTDSVSAALDIFKSTSDLILAFDELNETAETEKKPDDLHSLSKITVKELRQDKSTEIIDSVKTLDNFPLPLKTLIKEMQQHGAAWTLYTLVAPKIPYKKYGYSHFKDLIAEAEQKGIVETRMLKQSADELRLIPKTVSKTQEKIGIKTIGKIISTGKKFVRIQSQDDGIYRAYPENFEDKSLVMEQLLPNTQVGFKIQTPFNNGNEGSVQNALIIFNNNSENIFIEQDVKTNTPSTFCNSELIICGNCEYQNNCTIRFENKYDAQFEHTCIKFMDYRINE